MTVIKIITTMLLMICLTNCGTAPKAKVSILCESSFKFNRCRCWCYDVNIPAAVDPQLCGKTSDGLYWLKLNEERPKKVKGWNDKLQACDGYMGWHNTDWAGDKIGWLKELYAFLEDYNLKFQKLIDEKE